MRATRLYQGLLRRALLSLCPLGLLVGALACGSGSGGSGLPPIAQIQQLDFSFSPSYVFGFASANTSTISIEIENAGSVPHTFTIDELGVDVTLDPQSRQIVRFGNDAGSYAFYCRFHRERGMAGSLLIGATMRPKRP